MPPGPVEGRQFVVRKLLGVEQRRHHDQDARPEAPLHDPHAEFPDRDCRGDRVVRLLVHPAGTLRLMPDHQVIIVPEPAAAAEIHQTALVLPHDNIHTLACEHHDLEIRAKAAVRQQDVPAREPPVEAPEQRAFAGELALAGADRRVEDGPGGQRDQDHDPRDGEAAAGLLVSVLGVRGLVLGGVGHAHRGAVDEGDLAAVEQPRVGGVLLESVGGVADQPGQECLGEALTRLTVSTRVGRARRQPLGTAPGQQARDRGEAGMVVTEDLGEEGTKSDHGCEDPVAGLADLLGDDPGEFLGGEDVLEEEIGVEDEGAEQAAELCGVPPRDRIGHDRPSLSVESADTHSIEDEEGLSCIYPYAAGSYDSVSAIQLQTGFDLRFLIENNEL